MEHLHIPEREAAHGTLTHSVYPAAAFSTRLQTFPQSSSLNHHSTGGDSGGDILPPHLHLNVTAGTTRSSCVPDHGGESPETTALNEPLNPSPSLI